MSKEMKQMNLNIVLVEPEIPQNTGNIARTCAAIGAKLHLVKPLGFEISDKYLKRAGLDYWDKLEIEEHESLNDFLNKYVPEENNMFFVTTKGKHCYSDVDYSGLDNIFLLFGKETKGLPEDLLKKYIDNAIRIPMKKTLRSLNLSNSVAILAYEVLRQTDFESLQEISEYFDE
jgi:tRNA (cytidine/uridine-2'-O-)-methyltransferase